tara:strand:+ start:847 stop:1002 length:156 start_codon:yes stop_codon:yes gene_type:complete
MLLFTIPPHDYISIGLGDSHPPTTLSLFAIPPPKYRHIRDRGKREFVKVFD